MRTLLIDASDIALRMAELECASALLVMPCTDIAQAKRAQAFAASRAAGPSGDLNTSMLVAVHDAQRIGFIAVVNQMFKSSKSAWFGYLAQDAFAGRGWLALALNASHSKPGSLLAFNDGKWHGQLASFGLADRSWAATVYGGDFFFPGYHSHFADVELTLIAQQQARYIYEPNSVMIEVDWNKDQAGVSTADRRLFHTRLRQNVGGRVTDPALLGRFA